MKGVLAGFVIATAVFLLDAPAAFAQQSPAGLKKTSDNVAKRHATVPR